MVRIHVHRRPSISVGEGEDPCPDTSGQSGRHGCCDRQDQPDPARRDELLPARRVQTHLNNLKHFAEWRVIRWLRKRHRWRWRAFRRRFTNPNRTVAPDRSRRGRVVQPGIGDGHPLPLPGQQDPPPVHTAQPRLTAPTVESPVRREAHAGFGERPAETDRWQHRNRAAGRLIHRNRPPRLALAGRIEGLSAGLWAVLVIMDRLGLGSDPKGSR
ncbi:hypothetical protein EV191_1301 [Tamaricihabitans halophyticus]|uniref:Uncharacterized protein n=1 Tax=Tamaricihabitans halophyticus TaxID=1262583 RepID=A0A4R2PVS1_9PSEU|nr:hypothetical protein EV191_1301 [Tamaricihabitans halophyticus]